ncbi:MAG: hypothetical protein Q9161_007291 [Pseudevernia consocians]
MTYRPSGKALERHLDVPHRPDMPPGTRARNLVPGQPMLQHAPTRKSSLVSQEERRPPPPRNFSPDWEEERRLPPQRSSSPGRQGERRLPPSRDSSPDWHRGTPLADSDTLPARWRNSQPVNKETQDTNQGQPTSKGAKVHFQRPTQHRRTTAEDDDDEEEKSGSSSENSLRGSMVDLEKGDNDPDNRNSALSYYFDVIDHEGREDSFVRSSSGGRRP